MAAAITSAMLMGISVEGAKDLINQVRNVKFEGTHEQRGLGGPWISDLLKEKTINAVKPTGFSCKITRPEDVVVHATASGKDGTGPICRWKKEAAGQREFKATTVTIEDIEQAAHQFAGKLCVNCELLMRASLRIQVRQLWMD